MPGETAQVIGIVFEMVAHDDRRVETFGVDRFGKLLRPAPVHATARGKAIGTGVCRSVIDHVYFPVQFIEHARNRNRVGACPANQHPRPGRNVDQQDLDRALPVLPTFEVDAPFRPFG